MRWEQVRKVTKLTSSTPSELATRIAIFGTSYPASSMFVSFMQVAIQETLDGRHGVPGWKWL